MSNIFYIIIASLAFCSCTAQKKGNVYAYRQPVLQGAHPTVIIDEKGKEVEQIIKESANFYIYLESPSPNIEVKELWIKKKQDKAEVEKVSQTPVVIKATIRPNGEPDTLVQRTSNTVIQVVPQEETVMSKLSTSVSKKVGQYDLVIHCLIDGKDYYYTSAIKNLPPLALQ
ncbi:MAG TPA: hypothetical protein VGD17_08605 [Chitinophagaceae bacterium]